MKGKLLTPIKAVSQTREPLESLAEVFKKLGHSLDASVLQTSNNAEKERDAVGLEQLYKDIQRELKSADFLVAEISEPSSGIGYFIAQAIAERKPVLVLMRKDGNNKPPLPLQANPTKLVRFYTYNNKEEMDEIARNFLNEIKDLIDTKFILIISPAIDKYLEWSAQERRMHKAQIVRDAVETAMDKDKEYQQYLKATN